MIQFKINVNSIVDIITNSSSEIFTIRSEKTREFIADLINKYCSSIGLSYRIDDGDFTNPDEEWEFTDAVETLKKYGYKAVKDENAACLLRLSFDNNYGFTYQYESLFNFLQNTLNAERTYG